MRRSVVTIVLSTLFLATPSASDIERVSEGIVLNLKSSDDTLTPGGTIELTATVKNTSGRRIMCHVGWRDREHIHPNIGFYVRSVSCAADSVITGVPIVGLCSTGWVPEVSSLRRGRRIKRKFMATYEGRFSPITYLRIDHVGFAVEPPCTVAVRAFLKTDPSIYKEHSDDGRVFVGETESDEVIIYIASPGRD